MEGKNNCTDPELAPRSVVTAIFYRRIIQGLFPSLCKGENHGTVLEFLVKLINSFCFLLGLCWSIMEG